MYENILRNIGLSESEIKVYIALLETGQSSISQINEKTAIERRYIYDVLNKLIEKGLVSYVIEKKKRNFQITTPKRILGYLQEKKESIQKTEKEVNEILPGILKSYNKNKTDIKVEIYRGKEGMKAIGEDLLNSKNNYFIGGNGAIEEYMPFYWIHFNKKRIEKKVMWHDLIIEGSMMKTFKSLNKAKRKLKEISFYEYKVLPSELASPHVISIYGDKVAFSLWKSQPFNVVIQNKDISDYYLKYFNFLWKIAKK